MVSGVGHPDPAREPERDRHRATQLASGHQPRDPDQFAQPQTAALLSRLSAAVYPAQLEAPIGEMLILSAVFMLMTLLIFLLYGAFSAAMRGYVLTRPGVLQGLRACFAAGFVGLGVKLILAQR